MSTQTTGNWDAYEAENFQYQDVGSVQSWAIQNIISGFSGTSYIEATGTTTSGNSNQSAFAFLPTPSPASHQTVWARIKGGSVAIIYANDPQFDVLSVTTSNWTWVQVPTQRAANQQQIQLVTQDQGACVDQIIITDASETPTGLDGFCEPTTTNPPTDPSTDDGVCSGTQTTGCFACYETPNWLEPGANGAVWQHSTGIYITDSSTSSLADSPKAHWPIAPTIDIDWCTWIRIQGAGTFLFVWADNDASAVTININHSGWQWVKMPVTHDPLASKIKLIGQSANMQIDKIVQVNSEFELPTGTDGFCASNGSGTGGPPDNPIDDQNDDDFLYLPESLTCVITIIPPEPTNR